MTTRCYNCGRGLSMFGDSYSDNFCTKECAQIARQRLNTW
jgi:endogenous inhibitor of DNA gyrase (YacG/DUF329 family)